MTLALKQLQDPRVPASPAGIPDEAFAPPLTLSPSNNDPLFQAFALTKSYGGLQALAGVDLSIEAGRITGVIGPNGAGKTTLLNLMSGVERATSGRMVFAGRDITRLPPHRRAPLGLVRTFQISRDLGRLTVLENLLLAASRQIGETLIGVFFRPERVRREEQERIEKARGILQRVDLWRLADAPAATLSGGQKKLLELSRALMLDPTLVLLDEPAAGVAPAMEDTLIETIRSLAAAGVSVLIIEHDLDVVSALCQHVYVMASGKILMDGSFDEVIADTRVVEAYLGLKV
jgi:ABC-type branched-subunit amino acid transport system ATPase component